MPLKTSADPTDADRSSLMATNAEYLIFYSSVDETGKMWCPDCRRVEGCIYDAFHPEEAPLALIVFVGQCESWKGNLENPFRAAPWSVQSVPTILRLRDDARLVDAIDKDGLTAFIDHS